MAGCYGNDPEDKARERELNRYLDSLEEGQEDDQEYFDEERGMEEYYKEKYGDD